MSKRKNNSIVNSVTGGVPHHHWLAKVVIEGLVAVGAAGIVAVTYEKWVHRKMQAHLDASPQPPAIPK